MQALGAVWPRIQGMGATLAAVSPQTPEHSRATREQLGLGFPVLSDQGNGLAGLLGLVFAFDEPMKRAYLSFGTSLPDYNGDDSWTLPMPATYIVAPNRVVDFSFVDSDYTRRMEPDAVVERLAALVL